MANDMKLWCDCLGLHHQEELLKATESHKPEEPMPLPPPDEEQKSKNPKPGDKPGEKPGNQKKLVPRKGRPPFAPSAGCRDTRNR